MSEFQLPGANANVPIIGQPFVVKSGFVTVVGQCKCGGEETLVMIVGAQGECPSCHKVWGLQSVSFEASTGRFNCNISLVGVNEQRPGGIIGT